jgi:hypothetical protein
VRMDGESGRPRALVGAGGTWDCAPSTHSLSFRAVACARLPDSKSQLNSKGAADMGNKHDGAAVCREKLLD